MYSEVLKQHCFSSVIKLLKNKSFPGIDQIAEEIFVCWSYLSEQSHNWHIGCCLSPKWIRGNERDAEGLGEVYSPRPLLSSPSLDSLLMFPLSPHLFFAISSLSYCLLVFLIKISKRHTSCAFLVEVQLTIFSSHNLNQITDCCSIKLVKCILASGVISYNFFLILSTHRQPQLYSTNLFNLVKMTCYPHIHPFIRPPTPPAGRFSSNVQLYHDANLDPRPCNLSKSHSEGQHMAARPDRTSRF